MNINFYLRFAYTYCEKASIEKDGSYNFEIKKYNPINDIIQQVARKMKEQVSMVYLLSDSKKRLLLCNQIDQIYKVFFQVILMLFNNKINK